MNKEIRVMKFGGTSVGNAECIRRAAEIIALAKRDSAIVAVVSAMSGVTNCLIEAARQSMAGDEGASAKLAAALREQHATAINELISDKQRRDQISAETEAIITEVASLCRGTALLRELTPRALDAISSAGERLSVRLVAGALCEIGLHGVAVEATELIVSDESHGGAEPLMNETHERASSRLLPLIAEGGVPVVTGFIGATKEGRLTTLGRGGSDYSATILGAALEANEVVIWTDVDGVMMADPRVVAEASRLSEICYNEAAELDYFGAKVLHQKTFRPVTVEQIPVWIRNSLNPTREGTEMMAW